MDKLAVRKGSFITSDGGRAEVDPRRAKIAKGIFITSDGGPALRVPERFESQALDFAQLLLRLQTVRRQLEAYRK